MTNVSHTRSAAYGSALVTRWESYFARRLLDGGPYLDCDIAANILGEWLKRKGIPFEFVYGRSDEGSSHVWVEVKGVCYDPTEQGCVR